MAFAYFLMDSGSEVLGQRGQFPVPSQGGVSALV